MRETILVTGATGTVGKEIVKGLLSRDVCVRIAVRTIQKASELEACGCPVVIFDFEKPETFRRAFEGIDGFFLASPMHHPRLDQLLVPAIDCAKRMGVHHIVSLGAIGVDFGVDTPLSIAEKCVEKSGLDYTILRPNLLMQNFTTLASSSIRETNTIYLPAGNARISFVDARDVAEAAVHTLLEFKHRNKTYVLTGKEALDHYRIAFILSKVTGKTITYVPVSQNNAQKELIESGWEEIAADLMVGLYEIARHGWCEEVQTDLEEILQHEPILFEQFAWDYKDSWM